MRSGVSVFALVTATLYFLGYVKVLLQINHVLIKSFENFFGLSWSLAITLQAQADYGCVSTKEVICYDKR